MLTISVGYLSGTLIIICFVYIERKSQLGIQTYKFVIFGEFFFNVMFINWDIQTGLLD